MLLRLLRVIRDSAIYGTGNLLQPLLTLLLLPLYTRYLNQSEYGMLAMMAILPVAFGTLAAGGMKTAIYRHYYAAETADQRRRMLSTALWSIMANTVVLLGLGLLFAEVLARLLVGKQDVELATHLVRWTLLSGATVVIVEVPRNVLQISQHVKLASLINAANSLITVSTTLYLVVVAQTGIYGVIWGNMICNVVAMLLMFGFTAREYGFLFDVPVWRRMTRYALPFLPHRLQALGMTCFGDYMLTHLLGLDQTGLYTVAGRIAMPLMFASTALQTAWGPYKFKVFAEDPQAGQFFRSAFTYLFAGSLYLWVGLAALGPDILRLMTDPKFHAAAGLIWAVGFSRICQSVCPLMATGIELASNTTQLPLTSLAGLIAVIAGCALLIPAFGALGLGAMGAALATGCGWLTMAAGYYFVSQRQLYIPYDWFAIAALTLIAVACVALAIAAQNLPLAPRLASEVAICAAYPLFVVGALFRSSTERPRVVRLWSLVASRRGAGPN